MAMLNVQLGRQYAEALDPSSVYTSLADAEAYAKSNPYKYNGQVVAVVVNNEATIYKISNGELVSLESAPVDGETVVLDANGKVSLKGADAATDKQAFGVIVDPETSEKTFGFIDVDTSAIVTDISGVKKDVKTAQDAADAAQGTANTAVANAKTAQDAADAAQGTANTAVANAKTAQDAVDAVELDYLNKESITIGTDNKIKITRVGGTTADDSKVIDFVIQKALKSLATNTAKITADKDNGITDIEVLNSPKLGGKVADEYALASVVEALDTAVSDVKNKKVGNEAGNLVAVGADGKINSNLLGNLFITDVFTVVDKAAMVLLKAEQGDIAVVQNAVVNNGTAVAATYILKNNDPTKEENWVKLEFPCIVASVNGQTGVVVLTGEDIKVSNEKDAITVKAAIEAKQDKIADTSPLYALISTKKADLNKNRVLVTNTAGEFVESDVTGTELGYLSGLTEKVSDSLGKKEATANKKANIIDENGTIAPATNDTTNYPSVKAVTDYVENRKSAIETTIAAKFDATSGHTHNGTDSAKISYSDLKDTPTKVSEFTNDQKYQTESDVTTTVNGKIKPVTDDIAAKFDATSGHTHNGTDSAKISYSDLKDTPTKVSEFTNDQKYQTESDVTSTIGAHNTSEDAHTALFAKKQDKIISVSNVELVKTTWVDDTANSTYYKYTIEDSKILADSRIDVTPHIAGLATITEASVLPVVESETGKFYIYAKMQPNANFTIDYTIIPSMSV